jgi:glycosyltransferase involved in cell wall biosynthesis
VTAERPRISVVMPTLNSARFLAESLASIRDQDYPQELVEILLPDAGSTDDTRLIAERFGVQVLENPLTTGEAGKAVGLRAATGELVLSVDSDNVLVGRDWISRMVEPFADPSVDFSQAMRLHYRRRDHFVNRWHALVGAGDPMALYVGNYDRYSHVTNRWTDCAHDEAPRDGWLRVQLHRDDVPTLGANGFMFRRGLVDELDLGDYFFDIDVVYDLVQRGHDVLAMVDVPIRHYFCDGVDRFYRKTRRRVDDYFYFAGAEGRSYPWTTRRRRGLARFVVSTVLTAPLLVDAGRGYRRQPDPAWLFHVPACWITLGVYAAGTVRGRLRPRMLDRRQWRQ